MLPTIRAEVRLEDGQFHGPLLFHLWTVPRPGEVIVCETTDKCYTVVRVVHLAQAVHHSDYEKEAEVISSHIRIVARAES